MGSSIAWFSTLLRRTASSARVSRLFVSCDYGETYSTFRKVLGFLLLMCTEGCPQRDLYKGMSQI